MNSDDKVVPITRGQRKPNHHAFAVTVGSTRVDGAIDVRPTQRGGSKPATVVELRGPTGRGPSSAMRRSDQITNQEQSHVVSRMYRINEDKSVRVVDTKSELPDRAFASAEQLAELVADWPLRQFVELWNKLPGVRPLVRFENRDVAVQRIWRALNGTQPPARRQRAARAHRSRRTKTKTVLQMLRQPEGATLKALMKATRWQAHSVRGFLSRKVAKSLGLPLQSMKRDGERVYALPADSTLADR
jgi:hypothetical protein